MARFGSPADIAPLLSGPAILLLCSTGCGCVDEAPEPAPEAAHPPETAPEQAAEVPPARPLPPSAEQVLKRALREPGLPGAPGFEKARGAILARAKNEPVFFIRAPEEQEAKDEIVHYRWQVYSTGSPWKTLEELLPYFEHFPDKGRQTLLREGYLYAEDPNVAFTLVSLVGAHHLFDAEKIWIQRGERVMRAKREGYRYVFEDGPHAGKRVRLLHLDRLGSGDSPRTEPLHRDFRDLRYRLAFDRARIRHVTENRIVADLRYGAETWVPTILRSRGAHLELERELVDPGRAEELETIRDAARRRVRAVQVLRRVMLDQVAERLPFDEPRTEVEQEDGKLRRSWRFMYEHGRTSYRFRGDRYRVFDSSGHPLVPQVCVDFLLDTFERASGTWWRRQGQPPGRTTGRLDFERQLPRFELRRTNRFVEFAATRPEWFDVLDIPLGERIELGHKARFFEYLASHADDYVPGDMVFIRGKTPWDDREEHTHSFFVYETDPLTGAPIAIAGNPDTPSIWSWETEARRTPFRTLRYRVRPTLALLELAAPPDAPLAPEPPPLVAD